MFNFLLFAGLVPTMIKILKMYTQILLCQKLKPELIPIKKKIKKYYKNTLAAINKINCFLFSGFYHIKALHLTQISVPQIADFRDIVTLSCSYNMGTHTLNSVKWYKNDMEFFR